MPTFFVVVKYLKKVGHINLPYFRVEALSFEQ